MPVFVPIVLAIATTAATAATTTIESKLAVMPLVAKRVPKDTARVLDDILVSAIHRLQRYRVIGTSDIKAMLGLERMKDALGCEDVACAAEIGGALGADFLVSGSVGKLGDELFVSLALIDSARQEPVGRAQVKVAAREELYADAISKAVVELFGKPPTVEPQPAATSDQPWREAGVTRNQWIAYEHYRRAALDASYTPVPLKEYVATVVAQQGKWIDYFRYRRQIIATGAEPQDFVTWSRAQ